MPLLNHFAAPLNLSHPWRGFHSTWAATIARQLNDGVLPPRFHAIPNVELRDEDMLSRQSTGTPAGKAVPGPAVVVTIDFPAEELIEVQVFYDDGEPRLKASIELVSPPNKTRPAHRGAFTVKCASYLQSGVSVVVVDVVTDRRANLYQALVDLLDLPEEAAWQSPTNLYAAAYRMLAKEDQAQLEIWREALTLGLPLPQLPLWLGVDLAVPLDLERSYVTTCHDLRIRLAG
jgi:hypothetical protein